MEMDCRREEEGAVIDCWAGVVVFVGPVEPVRRLNMASIVGRSAAPKGVERKSEGRSNHVRYRLAKGVYKKRGETGKKRKKRAFDP